MNSKNTTKKKTILILIALLLIEVSVLIFFGFQKKGMHFDEFFSYFNTNNSFGRQAYDRTFVSSEDMLKDFYVIPGEGFNYSYVVTLQSYDVHPPVYYLILHTICSLTPNVFSYWQGLFLNIVCALLISVFLYLSVIRLTDNVYAGAVLLLLTSLCPGVISNTMFIRMYSLMTLFITIIVYLHIRMEDYEIGSLPVKYIVLNAILAYLGFLTHYFYLVFLFFIECAYIIPKLFRFKKNIKGILKYCIPLGIAGILGVISYPACLGQVNSGYRGEEVKSYMLDLSDLKERWDFFGTLLNKYVFNGFIYVYFLIALILFLTGYYISSHKKIHLSEGASKRLFAFGKYIFFPTLMYYLVSVKGSLMGDEAMMRYQLPVYALIIANVFLIIYGSLKLISKKKWANTYLPLILALSFLILDVLGLISGHVFYLYPEQEEMKEIAEEYSDLECVYIYNTENNKYFLWNDVEQLSKFKRVYFVDSENLDPIEEEAINNAESLVVYVSVLNENEDLSFYEDIIKGSNENITSLSKLYDGMYATCYLAK